MEHSEIPAERDPARLADMQTKDIAIRSATTAVVAGVVFGLLVVALSGVGEGIGGGIFLFVWVFVVMLAFQLWRRGEARRR